MQKYMSHPKLGGMLVYMDDFEQKQKEGWVFSEEVKPVAPSKPIVSREANETPEQQYEKKFGKLPHHRMTQENIKKALE
jgi:hypothetical protein